ARSGGLGPRRRLAGLGIGLALGLARARRRLAARLGRTRTGAAAPCVGGRAFGLGPARGARWPFAAAARLARPGRIAVGMAVGQAAAEHQACAVRIGRIAFTRHSARRTAARKLAAAAYLGAVHAIAFHRAEAGRQGAVVRSGLALAAPS